jgi:SAM-dependent methyltransferase
MTTLVDLARRAKDQMIASRYAFTHRNYPHPGAPNTPRYLRNHRRFVTAALRDEALVDRFRAGAQLPSGYGLGFDERVVELPWLLSKAPRGRVLDAGSSLNHPHLIDRFLPRVAELVITTLRPEPHAFTGRGVSYVYADLRYLPFRDGYFDTVVSVSTLEHVGKDVSRWGAHLPAASDPVQECAAAVAELRRVTAPKGRLLATVPYGVREDHGWLRQFDRRDVDDLIRTALPTQVDVTVYGYSAGGWDVSDLDRAAGARYQRENRAAVDPEREDRAPGARAVACVELRY